MLRLLVVIALVLVSARVLGGPTALNNTVHIIEQILQVSLAFLFQIIDLMVNLIESI